MTAHTRTTVPTPDGDMPAHLWLPGSGVGDGNDDTDGADGTLARPALLVLQEIFGVSGYLQQRCADLADLGYVVLAPELYWRIDPPDLEETGTDVAELLPRAMETVGRLDWDTAVADASAALSALQDRPGVTSAGLVGFCFGGGLAFNVAAFTEPAVLVSYYGSALPQLLELAPRVEATSLHHFGTADTFIPMPQVERIREAVTRDGVEFELHEGAGHAFDNPHPAFHHAGASADAWAQTRDFLARHLPTDQS